MSEHKRWFHRTNQESDSSFKVLIQQIDALKTEQSKQGAQITQFLQIVQRLQASQATEGVPTKIRPVSATMQATTFTLSVWLRYFEQLKVSGQLNVLAPDIQLMYVTLGTGYTPLDPTIHDLLSSLLLGQEQYAMALTEAEYALQAVKDHPRFVHRKGMAVLGIARNENNENVKVNLLQGIASFLEQYFLHVESAANNPDLGGLQGRIYFNLWEVSKNLTDLERSWKAYLQAWNNDETQYFPAINYAILYMTWLYKQGKSINEVRSILIRIIDMCKTLREKGETSFWINFTTGQAHLAMSDFESAKIAYKAGLACSTPPTFQNWTSAMDGVSRVAAINPDISNEAVQEIQALITPIDPFFQDNADSNE